MPAGKYRHRIRIESPTRTTDANGQQVTTWPGPHDPALHVWADVTVTRAAQAEHHHQQATYATAIITCRCTPDTRSVTPGMRVKISGETYEIGAAEDRELRGIEITMQATSIRAV
jgi:SPP1 family predicted phage head-tail adaptor